MISKVTLELLSTTETDFKYFLEHNSRISLSHRANNCFFVDIMHKDNDDYSQFMNNLKDTFKINITKQISLCSGKCRDGTNCLNRARYGEYCWRHKKRISLMNEC